MSSLIVALAAMVIFSFDAVALDINYPIYRCDKGKLMAVVGYKSRSDRASYLALYRWTKITVPGHGTVS